VALHVIESMFCCDSIPARSPICSGLSAHPNPNPILQHMAEHQVSERDDETRKPHLLFDVLQAFLWRPASDSFYNRALGR
jgi:hypothetical protein